MVSPEAGHTSDAPLPTEAGADARGSQVSAAVASGVKSAKWKVKSARMRQTWRQGDKETMLLTFAITPPPATEADGSVCAGRTHPILNWKDMFVIWITLARQVRTKGPPTFWYLISRPGLFGT